MACKTFSVEKRMARFENDIHMIPEAGCWIWTRNETKGGYGLIDWQGKPTTAHRAIYKMLVGDVPKGTDLDHLCRVRCCVNPFHLEPVSRSVNLRRGFEARGCKNGHPFSEDGFSLVRRANGTVERRCKICHRERNKNAKHRNSQLAQLYRARD